MSVRISKCRYAAKLLFRYVVRGRPRKKMLCESRIVLFQKRTPREAIAAARRYGRQASLSHWNPDGYRFAIEFLGIMEVLDLSVACEESEVWYNMFESVKPEAHLQPVRRFHVFRRAGTIGSAWFMLPRDMASPELRKPIRRRKTKKKAGR